MRTRKYIKIAAIVAVAAVIVGYSWFRMNDIWAGPEIVISNPKMAKKTDQQVIQLRGRAFDIAFLYLNGRQIFTDKAGHFSQTIVLSPGYNTITVRGRNQYGRQTREVIHIVYKTTDPQPLKQLKQYATASSSQASSRQNKRQIATDKSSA